MENLTEMLDGVCPSGFQDFQNTERKMKGIYKLTAGAVASFNKMMV